MRCAVLLCSLVLVSVACGPRYQVRNTQEKQWFAEARRSALDGGDVSDTTRDILRRRELLDLLHRNPREVGQLLDAEMRRTKDRKLALAIAEISYSRMRLTVNVDQLVLGTTLRYSYAYLFDPELQPAPNKFDIRFRWACDLYNRTLGDLVRFSRGDGRELRSAPLAWVGGSTFVSPGRIDLNLDVTNAESIAVAYDYEVKGLPSPRRFEGLGAPCVLISRDRKSAPGNSDATAGTNRRAFPATFLVRFPDDASILDDPPTPGSYDILDPTQSVSVSIGGIDVPLEIDFTTPIVYSIAQQEDQSPGLKALFRSDEWAKRGGLFALQPLREDRIPVILIHGLASDPFTWIPLYNDLMADDRIRTRFQFLVWFYPTGQPVILSAADLRARAIARHAELQQDGPHPALDAMVLCGHSLGGVLTHFLVIDPGRALEEAILRVPLDETDLSEADKSLCRAAVDYESLPFVTRAIFYATPHRGAPNAKKGLFEWLSGFIRLPSRLTGTYGRIRPYLRPYEGGRGATILGSLHPESPAILAMNRLPIAPHVRYHSIIGDKDAADRVGGSDGFVPYQSSHLEGADSELILHSGHGVQQRPLAARETRRILLKHLAAFDAAQTEKQ